MAQFSVFTRQVTFLALCSFKDVVARVGSVSVWFRPSKGRLRNGIFGLGRAKKWSESAKMKEGGGEERKPPTNPLPALLLAPFFRAVFDSPSSFFAPKLHGNACYAGLLCRKTGYEWP